MRGGARQAAPGAASPLEHALEVALPGLRLDGRGGVEGSLAPGVEVAILFVTGQVCACTVVALFEDKRNARVKFRPWGVGFTAARELSTIQSAAVITHSTRDAARVIQERQRTEWSR
jgi:hypothetical protein